MTIAYVYILYMSNIIFVYYWMILSQDTTYSRNESLKSVNMHESAYLDKRSKQCSDCKEMIYLLNGVDSPLRNSFSIFFFSILGFASSRVRTYWNTIQSIPGAMRNNEEKNAAPINNKRATIRVRRGRELRWILSRREL